MRACGSRRRLRLAPAPGRGCDCVTPGSFALQAPRTATVPHAESPGFSALQACACREHRQSILAPQVLRAGAGVSSSLCAWLGDARGCHLGAGGAAVLASSAPANAAFASELVQYTACYQLTAADACSATLGMCSWVASTGGARPVLGVPAAFVAAAGLMHSLCAAVVVVKWVCPG
jgi:hypothetical protein